MRLMTLLLASCLLLPAYAEEPPKPKLLGQCSVEDLRAEPYGEWSIPGFDSYESNSDVVDELKRLDLDAVQLTVYFGTWCGDSRREVPRLMRLAQTLGLDDSQVTWVAVDNEREQYKRSPDGEEAGKEIYRVPTILVERGGDELGRIIEHPLLSLERDLRSILRGEDYPTSYPVYSLVQGWLDEGLLSDPAVSARGLSSIARPHVNGRGDLAAAGSVLKSRGQLDEAVKLMATNCDLFWEEARSHQQLAEALIARGKEGDLVAAERAVRRAIARNDDPERMDTLLELLGTTKGIDSE